MRPSALCIQLLFCGLPYIDIKKKGRKGLHLIFSISLYRWAAVLSARDLIDSSASIISNTAIVSLRLPLAISKKRLWSLNVLFPRPSAKVPIKRRSAIAFRCCWTGRQSPVELAAAIRVDGLLLPGSRNHCGGDRPDCVPKSSTCRQEANPRDSLYSWQGQKGVAVSGFDHGD